MLRVWLVLVVMSLSPLIAIADDRLVTLAWVSQFGDDDADWLADICTGPDGSILACGYFTQNWKNKAFIRKVDKHGSLLWDHILEFDPGLNDEAIELERDTGGHAYLGVTAGSTAGPVSGNPYAVLVKYDDDGLELWRQLINLGDSVSVYCVKVELDTGGNPIVVCRTLKSGEEYFDILVLKYSPVGQELWRLAIGDAATQEVPISAVVDPQGRIYIGGYIYWTGGWSDGMLCSVSPGGALNWFVNYGAPMGYTDYFVDLDLTPEGHIVVLGQNRQPFNADADVILLEYSPDGLFQWSSFYYGNGGGWNEIPIALAIGGNGEIVVSAYEAAIDQPRWPFLILHYSSAGSLNWIYRDSSAFANKLNSDVTIDPNGTIYAVRSPSNGVSGFEGDAIVKLDSAGVLQWSAASIGELANAHEPRKILVDSFGRIVVGGTTLDLLGGNWQRDDFILKYYQMMCGDTNGSATVSLGDARTLIAYIFDGGPEPDPLLVADADCSGFANISDVIVLVNYIFSGGMEPCASCPLN